MRGCFRVGLYKRGLLHDLSKYSTEEFWAGVKYYQGSRSPNTAEREDKGYSAAWMHHKGRNKHHFEYWTDLRLDTKTYGPVDMPTQYLVEMVMDRIAACKTYQGAAYTDGSPLAYLDKARETKLVHPDTMRHLRFLLTMRHQWLATYFIPPDIIQQVRHDYGLAIGSAVGKESGWSKGDSSGADSSKVIEAHVTTSSSSEQTLTPEQQEAQKRDAFYELFWELDQTTMDAYVSANPDVIASGWDHILINEAGFDDQGTSIQTTM